jgi:nucleoside-diphosphate-sugar epimerase
MVDLYLMLLELPDAQIAGKIFNAGYQNYSVAQTATIVRDVVAREMPERGEIALVTTPSDDVRSYRLCADKIKQELGFVPKRTIEDGVRDLIAAFRANKLPEPMTATRYYNVRMMKEIQLS